MKRIVSLMLAAVLVLAPCMQSFATDPDSGTPAAEQTAGLDEPAGGADMGETHLQANLLAVRVQKVRMEANLRGTRRIPIRRKHWTISVCYRRMNWTARM